MSFPEQNFESFVDVAVVAQHICASRRQVLQLTRDGIIPGHPVDPRARRKDWRFKLSEVEAAMQSASYTPERQPRTRKAS